MTLNTIKSLENSSNCKSILTSNDTKVDFRRVLILKTIPFK